MTDKTTDTEQSSVEVIREEFEAILIDVIRNGGATVKDAEGNTIMVNGKPMREPASAAYLAVARTYLKDRQDGGVVPAGQPKGVLAKYTKRLEARKGNGETAH